jgi:DNA-binding response OmpR family regulator
MTMKILVVDDDSIPREVLRGFLVNQGYSALTAADGEEALKVFQQELVHRFFLTIECPDTKAMNSWRR